MNIVEIDLGTYFDALVFCSIAYVLQAKSHQSGSFDRPGLVQQDYPVFDKLIFLKKVVRERHRLDRVHELEAPELEYQRPSHYLTLVSSQLQLFSELTQLIHKLPIPMNRLKSSTHSHTLLPNNAFVISFMHNFAYSECTLYQKFICPFCKSNIYFCCFFDQILAEKDIHSCQNMLIYFAYTWDLANW